MNRIAPGVACRAEWMPGTNADLIHWRSDGTRPYGSSRIRSSRHGLIHPFRQTGILIDRGPHLEIGQVLRGQRYGFTLRAAAPANSMTKGAYRPNPRNTAGDEK